MQSRHRDRNKGASRRTAGALLGAGAVMACLAGCFIQPETLPPRPGESTGTGDPGCGDGECGGEESVETCPEDCALCGDGACSPTEDAMTCPGDCPGCGDGACTGSEDVATCPQDCIVCGDGTCSLGESGVSCPEDCPVSGCPDEPSYDACTSCLIMAYPEGAEIYGELSFCVACEVCYHACDGGALGCPMAPPTKHACDSDTPEPAACGATECTQCAFQTDCADELEACQNNPSCIAFLGELSRCPQ